MRGQRRTIGPLGSWSAGIREELRPARNREPRAGPECNGPAVAIKRAAADAIL